MTVELITRYAKLLIYFAVVWLGIMVYNNHGCRKAEGPEMEPSISRDKWNWVRPRLRDPETQLGRGDVIFYRHLFPHFRKQSQDTFLGRVMGLPGDRVKIVKGEVFVNGNKAADAVPVSHRGADDFEEVIVPRSSVFVLCDNRRTTQKYDSRGIGPVGKWAILGKIK